MNHQLLWLVGLAAIICAPLSASNAKDDDEQDVIEEKLKSAFSMDADFHIPAPFDKIEAKNDGDDDGDDKDDVAFGFKPSKD